MPSHLFPLRSSGRSTINIDSRRDRLLLQSFSPPESVPPHIQLAQPPKLRLKKESVLLALQACRVREKKDGGTLA